MRDYGEELEDHDGKFTIDGYLTMSEHRDLNRIGKKHKEVKYDPEFDLPIEKEYEEFSKEFKAICKDDIGAAVALLKYMKQVVKEHEEKDKK